MTRARAGWLAGSLALVAVAIVLFVTHHDFPALTALVAAFLAVAASKRVA